MADPIAAGITPAQQGLSSRPTLFCRLAEPFGGSLAILFHPLAIGIKSAELELGLGITCLGGLFNGGNGGFVEFVQQVVKLFRCILHDSIALVLFK